MNEAAGAYTGTMNGAMTGTMNGAARAQTGTMNGAAGAMTGMDFADQQDKDERLKNAKKPVL